MNKKVRSLESPILPPEPSFLVNKCYQTECYSSKLTSLSQIKALNMKCKFQVMVALTYKDEDIEVEIDLSD